MTNEDFRFAVFGSKTAYYVHWLFYFRNWCSFVSLHTNKGKRVRLPASLAMGELLGLLEGELGSLNRVVRRSICVETK